MAEKIEGSTTTNESLDNSEFNLNLADLENRIGEISQEEAKLEEVLKKTGASIKASFSVSSLKEFNTYLSKVRSEIQSLEGILKKLGASIKTNFAISNLQSFNTNLTKIRTTIQGLETILKKLGAGIKTNFAINSLQSFNAQLIKIRAEIQTIEANLKSFLSAGVQARGLMKELQEYSNSKYSKRRVKAEKEASKDLNKLFMLDLEHKKQEYELYYKWVEHLGQEAADKQFKNLLKSGDSYQQYVEKQIATIENDRLRNRNKSPESSNRLIELTNELKVLKNQVNPLEAFTASLPESILGVANLGKDLELVLQKKKELEEGTTGIVNQGDLEIAKKAVDSKEEEINKKIQQKLLTDFKSYQDKKLDIEKEYGALISAANDEEVKKRVEKQKAIELSTLNASALMDTDSWKTLFSELDTLA